MGEEEIGRMKGRIGEREYGREDEVFGSQF